MIPNTIFRLAAFVLGLVTCGLLGCSTPPPPPPFSAADGAHSVVVGKAVWKKKMDGLITDLSLASKNGSLLVTTIPDPDRSGGQRGYLLTLFTSEGKSLFSIPMKSQVKSQVISQDGSLIVVANYEGKLLGFDPSGKELWSAEASCRPLILESIQRVVCHHDDDVKPSIAFDVFDWQGKKLSAFPIHQDVLTLKEGKGGEGVEPNLVAGLTKGRVILFGKNLRALWNKQVPGEIIDVAVSSGNYPRVAVLFNSFKKGQRLIIYDVKGKLTAEAVLASHVDQLEISADASKLAVYGNGPRGQYLGFYAISTAPVPSLAPIEELHEKWHRGDARFADYSTPMILNQDSIVIGFEDVMPGERRSEILGFDPEGYLKWRIPLVTEEGAYLYSLGVSAEKGTLGVGTDDSVVSYYSLSQ